MWHLVDVVIERKSCIKILFFDKMCKYDDHLHLNEKDKT